MVVYCVTVIGLIGSDPRWLILLVVKRKGDRNNKSYSIIKIEKRTMMMCQMRVVFLGVCAKRIKHRVARYCTVSATVCVDCTGGSACARYSSALL